MRIHYWCWLPLLLAGCTVGPNYKRPSVPVPADYRGAPAQTSAASLADTKWPDLFQDDSLKHLIAAALEHNFDLALASERVEEARARFRITGANQYPFLYAAGQFDATRPSSIGANTQVPAGYPLDASYTQAGAALSWELDLWGRLRRLTESARAQYLATEEARRGVIVSLIGDVAGNYFTLRERDLELEIAGGTRDIAARNLELVRVRHDHGAATGLDVHQAEQFLYLSTAQIASSERDIGQAENALSLLIGQPPGDIARGKPMDDYGLPPVLPPGLPSSLLERRPDIREAEESLIAANAQIGVAKAYYFPQISLTGFLGGQSRALTDLFTGPARFWTISPTALLPIFTASQVRVGVRLSETQKREMVISYQKAIYNGFREVSDALVRYDRTREQRTQQDLLVHALTETSRLSNLRYQGGMDSYLQVLDAERNLFQGRLVQAQLRLQELLSYVQLYRALGGGWQNP
ncbi:MAG TPA: efflux transporter outer membrane subunit [Bryobacteraceae bacterium]|nr:efflux transporter outer membrane subunit [Bryobacteraceae bacterium]